MNQGSFHSMWGGSDDLFDAVSQETCRDHFDDVENYGVVEAGEETIEDAMLALSDKSETTENHSREEENHTILCGNPVCSEQTDGMNCTSCGFDFQKPHQFQTPNNINLSQKTKAKEQDNFTFNKQKLASRHFALTNSSSSDGEVHLNGFERNLGTVTFKVSIRQRSEKYKRLHVGRRKGPTGKYDGEEVRTEKLVSKPFIKDIRIHLGPHSEKPGVKKIIGIYSGVKSNGKPYIKEGDKWLPKTLPTSKSGKRTWLPLDHASIKEICMECAEIYMNHMAQ